MLLVSALLMSACSSSEDVASTSSNSSSNETVDTATLTDDYTYELPVIFHVLYNNKDDQSQYIPYQRISNLVKYVNEISPVLIQTIVQIHTHTTVLIT